MVGIVFTGLCLPILPEIWTSETVIVLIGWSVIISRTLANHKTLVWDNNERVGGLLESVHGCCVGMLGV